PLPGGGRGADPRPALGRILHRRGHRLLRAARDLRARPAPHSDSRSRSPRQPRDRLVPDRAAPAIEMGAPTWPPKPPNARLDLARGERVEARAVVPEDLRL